MNIPKFRAYIKESRKIHQVATLDLPTQTIQAFTKKVKVNFESRLTLYNFDEIELMQYTGKKDIYDIEIYEGDIILFSLLCGEIHIKKKPGVIWYDDATFFARENYGCLTALQRLSRGEIEIIGNIHQNPELLSEV